MSNLAIPSLDFQHPVELVRSLFVGSAEQVKHLVDGRPVRAKGRISQGVRQFMLLTDWFGRTFLPDWSKVVDIKELYESLQGVISPYVR